MAFLFGDKIDLNGYEALKLRAENAATAPVTANAGQIYFDTAEAAPYYYDGSQWIKFGTTTASALSWKNPAKAATTQDLTALSFGVGGVTYANGTAGVGATLTQAVPANGALDKIDSVTLSVGDRLLVKDQTVGIENGIYEVTDLGDGATTPWVLTRVVDADEAEEMNSAALFVSEGDSNADKAFVQTADDLTIGTKDVVFQIFSLNLDYATAAEAEAKTDTTKIISPSALTNFAISKELTITGDGSTTTFTISHGLGTYVSVFVINTDLNQNENPTISNFAATNGGEVDITFGGAPSIGASYRVMVVGL